MEHPYGTRAAVKKEMETVCYKYMLQKNCQETLKKLRETIERQTEENDENKKNQLNQAPSTSTSSTSDLKLISPLLQPQPTKAKSKSASKLGKKHTLPKDQVDKRESKIGSTSNCKGSAGKLKTFPKKPPRLSPQGFVIGKSGESGGNNPSCDNALGKDYIKIENLSDEEDRDWSDCESVTSTVSTSVEDDDKFRKKVKNTVVKDSSAVKSGSSARVAGPPPLKPSKVMGLKNLPMINGKELDLDLLYQIVTSHGGWEKVNARNEWDDLLEHFHLPRGINGGLVIKQIYLKYLETYERIYFLGEDVENKEGFEDDFDDNRYRRRHTTKLSSRSNVNTPGTANQQPSQQQQQLPVPLSESMREQLGLSTQLVGCTDYDRLLLSLQSPLPNDQDLAISVCTLLSNETKHVLKFSKCPAILNMLLAHSGIFNHCGLRTLMEGIYTDARGMNLSQFWDDIVDHNDTRPLLCECYVDRVQTSLGLIEEEEEDDNDDDMPSDVLNCNSNTAMDIDDSKINLEENVPESTSPIEEPGSAELIKDVSDSPDSILIDKDPDSVLMTSEISTECSNSVPLNDGIKPEDDLKLLVTIKDEPSIDSIIQQVPENLKEELFPSPVEPPSDSESCCTSCPCQRRKKEFGVSPIVSRDVDDPENQNSMDKEDELEEVDIPFCLSRSAGSEDKVGQRIQQIAHILRNLSFEEDNAGIMASNSTLLRYLLITANCSWGNLPQMSYDLLGNIAGHIKLQDPLKDPISSMLLTLVSSGLFSPDRFKVLRSLEVLRDLTKTGRNETIIVRYLEKKVYERMCELLTVCDIMLLIYTLECILSMTGLGEAVCNELVRVKGSVATLVSLVTVEAQSYGPKGCILMRVVETVTGGSQSSQSPTTTGQQQSTGTTTVGPPQISPAPVASGQQNILQPPPAASPTLANTIPLIGLRTVTGHTVVPPAQQTGGAQGTPMSQQPISSNQSTSGIGGGNFMNTNTPLQQQQLRTVLRPTVAPNCGTTISATPLQSIQVVQVSRPANSVSPSLPLLNRSLSPLPVITPVSQVQTMPVTGSGLPILVNHLNTNSVTVVSSGSSMIGHLNNNSKIVMSQISGPSSPHVNNINHVTNVTAPRSSIVGVGATPVIGGLAQVSSQSLTQQVYTPSFTPIGVAGEENWLLAWLKGAFEVGGGSSIEQKNFYSMYCSARSDDGAVLPMDKFMQCVKSVYGASVGPVMKNMGGGGSPLAFIEGIKPKISLHPPGPNPVEVGLPRITVPVSTTNTNLVNSSNSVVANNIDGQNFPPVTLASNGITASNNQANASTSSVPAVGRPTTPVQSPTSLHIPSPLSPILKATLSRPPTPKSPPRVKRGRAGKVKDKKNALRQSPSKKKSHKGSPEVHRMVGKQQVTTKGLSPSSSAIRSLLASKVAQRQQKKLQQQQKSKNNSETRENSVRKGKKKAMKGKMNGSVDPGSEKGEESSASSSLNSIEESEIKTDPNTLTFQGVLCNGTSAEDSSKEQPMEVGTDSLEESRHNLNSLNKGMLVDLLERKVLPRDPVNGLIGRELRISDKGLEIIDNLKEDSNSVSEASLLNNTLGGGDSQEPQQMTFYASTPDVVSSGQVQTSNSTEGSIPSGTVLLSGGGTMKAQQPQVVPEEVKPSNNELNQEVVMSSENETLSYGADGDGNSIANCEMGSNGGSNSNGGGCSSGDLLEKFSQFSDLIVVNPEQLGLKRPAPTTSSSDGTNSSMDEAPPVKKPAFCVNGSDVPSSVVPLPAQTVSPAISVSTMGPKSSVSSPSVLHTALSIPSTTSAVQSTLVANACNSSVCSAESGKVAVTATTNNNQMVHLPVRLSVNPQNPQQLTFSARQLVLPPGQQFLLSTGNSQTGMAGLQGQVIISKSTGTSNDIQRAIILLHPNHQPQQQSQQVVTQQQNHSVSLGNQTQHSLSLTQGQVQTTVSAPTQVQLGFSLAAGRKGIPPSVYSQLSNEQLEHELPFLCEWTGCGFRFPKYQQVFMHAIKAHVPESTDMSIACKWGVNGCDPHLRKRFSVMTHLQDRHCSKQALDLAVYRRKNKIDPPPAPSQTVNHPGYAPNAAFHAIKRHALQYMNPKEIIDENEGPVTKSIRLTAALILRNLVNYSRVGRRMIGSYESHLSSIAMSNVESSRTIAQMLHDMSESETS